MQAKVSTLSFHSNKNCFISLPRTWTSKLPRDKILPFEVSSEDTTVFVSWAGSVSGPGQHRSLDSEVVEINGLFGSKQGLRHGQEVLVSPLSSAPPCDRIYVEPVSIGDWEILEMHATFVESNLLNQVRVVWAEQIIPMWVQKSICVFVKIGRIESASPSSKCYLLEQNTEVVVSPKVRAGGHHRVSTPVKSRPPPKVPPTSPVPPPTVPPPVPQPELQEAGPAAPGPSSGDSLQPEPDDPLQDISGFSSLDNSFTEEPNDAGDVPGQSHAPVPGQSVQPPSPGRGGQPSSLESILPPSVSQDEPPPAFDSLKGSDTSDSEAGSLHQRLWSSIRSWWDGKEATETDNQPGSNKHVQTNARDIHYDDCLRVCALPEFEDYDIDPHQTSVMSSSPKSYINLFTQSTNVFVKRRDILDRCPKETAKTLPSSFLASLVKLASPAEKGEQVKSSMSKRGERALRRRAGGETTELLEHSEVTYESRPVIVRVVVLDCNQCCQVDGGDGEKAGTGYLDTLSWLPDGHILVNNLLRRQIGLEMTSRVRITSFLGQPHQLTQLSVHRLFPKPSGFTKDMFETVVEVWLSKASSEYCPVIVNQGTIVKCWVKEGIYGEFLLTFHHKPPATLAPPLPYIVLTEDIFDQSNVKVEGQVTDSSKPAEIPRLPYYTVDQIDMAVPETTMNQLGGVSEFFYDGVEHVAMCFACTPLTRHIFHKDRGIKNGGILMTGLKGGGKTSLAQAICNEVANKPPWPFIVSVECKSLKGKRTENIRTHFESVLNELSWREPGVLFLDDLDSITSVASGPEHEMSGEAQYHMKNAEVLKELLVQEKKQNTRLAVIATCKSASSIHPVLTSPTGHHIFQETLTIKPPGEETRKAILNAVIARKTNVSVECVQDLDLGRIAQKTEGFVARDLESVVDRAVHAHLVTKGKITKETKSKELKLTNADLESALEDYTPAALRNVSLHKSGELGWADVGGLHDVRQALVQTLEWPAKYPKLFASCPLRLRSGLLLYGAPGTGKTLLAGVVARECGLNFISIKGPELLSKYIGASEQAVRDIFNRAQSARPCILFFDEFDSLAPRRGHDSTGVTDRVVNQLLTQLDGVEGLEGVYVLAATSRPDLIDPALLRPGRLDKALHCGLPAKEERLEILRALTRNMDMDDDVDLRIIADNSDNLTGADFKALLYNAQLEAVHQLTDRNTTHEEGEAERTDTGTTEFVYLPNLEEGVTTLPVEKHSKLLIEVESCLAGSSLLNPSKEIAKSHSRVIVGQGHLVNALRALSPSVSDAERLKYRRIYEQFVASRGGNFSDGVQTVGKRATLA